MLITSWPCEPPCCNKLRCDICRSLSDENRVRGIVFRSRNLLENRVTVELFFLLLTGLVVCPESMKSLLVDISRQREGAVRHGTNGSGAKKMSEVEQRSSTLRGLILFD